MIGSDGNVCVEIDDENVTGIHSLGQKYHHPLLYDPELTIYHVEPERSMAGGRKTQTKAGEMEECWRCM